MKHLLTVAALVAFGFALSPGAARAQATDQPATTSPAATATVNPMESPASGATATTPPDQTTTTAASSSTTSGPWGLIGLLGLLGLIGLRGRGTTTTTEL